MWTSLDCGISFASASSIRQQMDGKDRDGKDANRSSVSRPKLNPLDQFNHGRAGSSSLANEYTNNDARKQSDDDKSQPTKQIDPHSRFNALKAFYKEQLLNSDSSQTTSSFDVFSSSPSSLSRLMSLYGTGGSGPASILGRKAKQKPTIMREALYSNEGLQITSSQPQDAGVFDYTCTPTPSQLNNQYPQPLGNPTASNISLLKPMPAPLRTKRSKRCATCKHILVKPELKVTSTRYRIKLIALNYIPHITLKPVPVTGGRSPAGPDGDPDVRLAPGKPSQWILTMRNPLFENVNVSLGSPSVTPGKHGHKVTILCPEFAIGKNGDAWDDASLSAPSTTAATGVPRSDTTASLTNEQVAGKAYDKGRNWTSIVVEIVPGSIVTEKGEVLAEDEDVVEIPVRVRLEWKVTDDQALRDASSGKKDDDGEVDDGNRELAYWMILGVGRVG